MSRLKRKGFQACTLHEFPISAHIYSKPAENTKVSERKADDSDLYDQYRRPKKEQCQEVPGPENGWWKGGIGH